MQNIINMTNPHTPEIQGVQHANVGARKVDVSRGAADGRVSSQWFNRPMDERFLDLNSLREAKKIEFDGSRAQTYDSKDLEVIAPPEVRVKADAEDLRVALPHGDGLASPTHWSFGQTCSLLKAPAGYLRTLPAQIAADNLNWGLMKHRQEMVKVYHRTDGEQELRAVTGPDYGRIGDYEVVEAVQRVAGNGTGDTRWKIPGMMDWSTLVYDPDHPVTKETTTLFASDRDIWMFLCDDKNPIEIGKLKNGEPDLLNRGFIVWNSEVGSKSMGIAAFYFRAICCNRILWGVENMQEITMRHSKNAPDKFAQEAAPALLGFAESSTADLLAGVQAAQEAKVASDEEEALAWLQGRKFSKSKAKAILDIVEEEEGHPARSAWDMAQGITAIARDIPHQDERIAVERQAKAILDKVI